MPPSENGASTMLTWPHAMATLETSAPFDPHSHRPPLRSGSRVDERLGDRKPSVFSRVDSSRFAVCDATPSLPLPIQATSHWDDQQKPPLPASCPLRPKSGRTAFLRGYVTAARSPASVSSAQLRGTLAVSCRTTGAAAPGTSPQRGIGDRYGRQLRHAERRINGNA
jgi:hypothetical protein